MSQLSLHTSVTSSPPAPSKTKVLAGRLSHLNTLSKASRSPQKRSARLLDVRHKKSVQHTTHFHRKASHLHVGAVGLVREGQGPARVVAHQRLAQPTHQLTIHLTTLPAEGRGGVQDKGVLPWQHLCTQRAGRQENSGDDLRRNERVIHGLHTRLHCKLNPARKGCNQHEKGPI